VKQAQALGILKKAIAIACFTRRLSQTPDSMRRYRFSAATTLCGGSASLPIALINSFLNLVP